MQKCLEFQLNKEYFIIIFAVIGLFSINYNEVFAETDGQIDISEYYTHENFETGLAEVIQSEKIIYKVGRDTSIQITHIITGTGWSTESPKLIKILDSPHSNLIVNDEDGDHINHGFVGETFEESEYVVVGQKPHKGVDIHVEYTLDEFFEYDNGLWTKNIVHHGDVIILIDEDIELVYVNSTPVNVKDSRGLNCIGCDMKLEFFDDIDPIKKSVVISENKLEEISNSGKEFTLEFISNGKINDITFLKELNYFSFIVDKENQLITMKIPMDLILSPYHVYLTEFGQEVLQEQNRIKKVEFGQTETYTNLTFRPPTEGIIHVVGSSQMEHEELMKKTEKESPKPVVEKTPDSIEVENNKGELYKNWDNIESENDNSTMIYAVIGAAVIGAAVIGAAVIKLKKN